MRPKYVEQGVFCNITGSLCRHCSVEYNPAIGSYCDINTRTLWRTKARHSLGQLCNCESKWVADLDHCPLKDCVSPDDTWEETVEKKQVIGQQELL